MNRRYHSRRRSKDPAELDMTTFLNLMVVLVPFLLITAVFSRITIVELSLPSAAGAAEPQQPTFVLEVIVREGGIEVTNGRTVIEEIPKVEEAYDLAKLSESMQSLKQRYPDKEDASVLLEPHIEYDHLIRVMDVVRSAEVATENGEGTTQLALFGDISIGDAP